jgi:hypothetical protein
MSLQPDGNVLEGGGVQHGIGPAEGSHGIGFPRTSLLYLISYEMYYN